LGNYLVPFEIVSVLLLAVMIGAAYLAKARRHGDDKRP
jgi:NADH:ubiquinone oxidoreductase subunit 6 (subunit J)